ncbi:hypothetical protein [Streptomyces aidingensis]|uniref:Uncharacterized protein n=1 Tax=Streptomyces aidingensis TaxID=910347 RepID=A0A1I1V666_9ACTN|nr:hypothetical protein [Streptomyces aidingensis]SFD78497.1 hypothetical protein SAMN05421773_13032 [Streptomyces aidingensis]
MILSVSALLLLGLLIWFLIRVRYLRWLEALICVTFGFLLARSVIAPFFEAALHAVGAFLGEIRL